MLEIKQVLKRKRLLYKTYFDDFFKITKSQPGDLLLWFKNAIANKDIVYCVRQPYMKKYYIFNSIQDARHAIFTRVHLGKYNNVHETKQLFAEEKKVGTQITAIFTGNVSKDLAIPVSLVNGKNGYYVGELLKICIILDDNHKLYNRLIDEFKYMYRHIL